MMAGPPVIPGYTDPVEIGRGGFGTVYRATEVRFDRDVAVKVIRGSGLADEVVARFERECRALGSLSGHPNIVAVHGSGQTESGELYLAMEHLSAGSLAQRVAADGPSAAATVIAWGAALAGALETAHRAGIVHRDVKPENVLFNSFGTPKLVDFGIARMRSAYETRSGSISATLAHAAPEVIAGSPVTAQADVYSLASVLFFALAGEAAFERPGEESLAPLIARVSAAPPPDLRDRGVPGPLAQVITTGLAKAPADRHPSAAAMGEALRRVATEVGEPVPDLPIGALTPRPSETEGDESTTPSGAGTQHVARHRTPAVEAVTDETAPRRSRVPLVAALTAVAVLAVVGVGAAATGVFSDREIASEGDGEVEADDEPDLTAPSHAELEDEPYDDAGLRVARTYRAEGGTETVTSSTDLRPSADATGDRLWFEVIPGELASSLDDVTFSRAPDGVLDGHLVVYWIVEPIAGTSSVLSWSTALPDDGAVTTEYLEQVRAWHRGANVEAAALIAAASADLEEETGAESIEAIGPLGGEADGTDGGGSDGTGGWFPPSGGGGTGSTGDTGGTGPSGGSDPTGGSGSTDTGGSDGGSTGPTPTPTKEPEAQNRAPTVSVSDRRNDELANVDVTFSVSDPDGDPVTVTVSGLPAGLSASGARVTGRVAHNAASTTTDRRNGIGTRDLVVTVTARDDRGASTSKSLTWTIRDTHRTMPNYIDQYGCGGCGGLPDIAAISVPQNACAYDPGGDGNLIYRQGVAPGSVIAWGQSIGYWYGTNDTSCPTLAKGW